MPPNKLYLIESAIYDVTATITGILIDPDGRVRVRLDRVIHHPQGGGQQADRGDIAGRPLTHVSHSEDGEIDHVIADAAGLVVGQAVDLRVDQQWRERNATLHTAGHLIASCGEAQFPGTVAVAGHHWEGQSRVEFEAATMPACEAMERALIFSLAKALAEDELVAVTTGADGVRRVQIGSRPPVPCGGTHVPRLSVIRRLVLASVRMKSGRMRVSYTVE